MRKITPLAQEHLELYRSPDPRRLYAYSPGLASAEGGHVVATMEVGGPGVEDLPGPKWRLDNGWYGQGKVFTSEDGGRTWAHRVDFPFSHARPFYAGGVLYVLGQEKDLKIIRSDDGGLSWTPPSPLTQGEFWHQAPCNVHYGNGCVYLVMERRITFDVSNWYIGEMAPVLMRGRIGADLTRRENWEFSSCLSFRDTIPGLEGDPAIDWFGVPYFPCPYPDGTETAPNRWCAPMGWLETNVVRITDPDHVWHDPTGRTLHLLARAHTGGTGYACLAKVVEDGPEPGTGAMRTMLETVPSGKRMLFLPCPGGQMKFHVLQDAATGLYWLLSTQATDSMRRADRMPADRYNLPNNERRRLQLHFSRNLVDWCFAGLVAVGPTENGSRHYASMAIVGGDLLVLSRSGTAEAASAHNGNLITLHRVEGFRGLAYL